MARDLYLSPPSSAEASVSRFQLGESVSSSSSSSNSSNNNNDNNNSNNNNTNNNNKVFISDIENK